MELFCCVLRGRALRWLFSSLFLFFKSEGVFIVLRKRYVAGYNAISRKKKKICKTDGY